MGQERIEVRTETKERFETYQDEAKMRQDEFINHLLNMYSRLDRTEKELIKTTVEVERLLNKLGDDR